MKNRKQVKHTQCRHNNIFGAPSNKSVCPHQIKLYIKTKTEKKIQIIIIVNQINDECVCGGDGGVKGWYREGICENTSQYMF